MVYQFEEKGVAPHVYILAMLSSVDNAVSEYLILSVRDDIFPDLMGHHYNYIDEINIDK
ncbi:MAG: hypothetical protein RSC93_12265 [Erysipelotrichaceae bacterium]